MATKVELNCEMTCDNCANKIRQALSGLTGITLKSIDVSKQQVLIEVNGNAELTIPDLQNQIEDTTGLRTVIKGVGEGLATVSEFNGPGIVRYRDVNLLFKLPPAFDKSYQATFIDNLLEKSWNQVQTANDLFLFKFNPSAKKVIPGKYKFLAQLNVGRAVSRRPPQLVTSLTLPFDGNKFNFNKIKPKELLFKVSRDDSNYPVAHIIINNSPIEYCSSLMVIDPKKCLPQRLTSASLQMAIEFCALSAYLRMGFNSLGAEASVNHCHWHVYYQKDYLYLQSVSVVSEEDPIFTDYPLPGFMFEINSGSMVPQVVSKVMKLVDHVYTHEDQAYNLFITRSELSGSIRVFIWIRKASFGVKNQFNFNPAFLELSGFFCCKSEQSMIEIDQNYCEQLLQSIQIDSLNEYRNLLKK